MNDERVLSDHVHGIAESSFKIDDDIEFDDEALKMPEVGATITGTWDTVAKDITEIVLGRAYRKRATREFAMYPRGTGWPWYPVIEGTIRITDVVNEVDTAAKYHVRFEWTTPPTSRRIGVRRWWHIKRGHEC